MGKKVSGGEDCVWRKGYLALESEGGEVDWRDLRIKELLPSGATPEQTAPVAEPWVSLYDGRSLRGWREAAGWKPADWQTARRAAPRRSGRAQLLATFDLQTRLVPRRGAVRSRPLSFARAMPRDRSARLAALRRRMELVSLYRGAAPKLHDP
jgi:hypothetical protein